MRSFCLQTSSTNKWMTSQQARQPFRAVNSAVECHLHTVEVTGSIPVSPTRQHGKPASVPAFLLFVPPTSQQEEVGFGRQRSALLHGRNENLTVSNRSRCAPASISVSCPWAYRRAASRDVPAVYFAPAGLYIVVVWRWLVRRGVRTREVIIR